MSCRCRWFIRFRHIRGFLCRVHRGFFAPVWLVRQFVSESIVWAVASVANWSERWDKQLAERRKADGLDWQLPPLEMLSLLHEQMSAVDGVLEAFGLHPLFKGWYRSCEQDENGYDKVFNIVTGETSIEPEIKRYDICCRLCYLRPEDY